MGLAELTSVEVRGHEFAVYRVEPVFDIYQQPVGAWMFTCGLPSLHGYPQRHQGTDGRHDPAQSFAAYAALRHVIVKSQQLRSLQAPLTVTCEQSRGRMVCQGRSSF